MSSQHAAEIEAGDRFGFGENWSRFLTLLDDDRIRQAEHSLCTMLETESLLGKSFLDVGSGSGLFSLAARNLGASVHSFDYDPQSVACTAELKRRYYRSDPNWVVQQGSVLDERYVRALGRFDVVYSWGVLHHTGHMYKALADVVPAVAAGGQLFVAVYNDQGFVSRYWYRVKRAYNHSALARIFLIAVHAPYLYGLRRLVRVVGGRGKLDRGMSLWHDMIDWLGGYPFEVAKPEEIFALFRQAGFSLERLKTCGGRMGCNEFVFRRHGVASPPPVDASPSA